MSNLKEQMLSAVLGDESVETSEQPDVTDAEKIGFLMKNVGIISIEERKSLGRLMRVSEHSAHLKSCNDGTLINLDLLPKSALNMLYNRLQYIMSKR